MKTESRFHGVLRGVRMVASILTIVVCATWLASEVVAQDPPTQDPPGKDPNTMCQFHNHPDVGPCDKTKGYMWEGICWLDDGCYSEIEGCCARP